MGGYDIIGDIHGRAEKLRMLLDRLGYAARQGFYSHPERTAIYVGDFIDRGPYVRETLQIVRAMIDHGSALAVLGNHEVNALALHAHARDAMDGLSQDRSVFRQHAATLESFREFPTEWESYLEWFYSVPLYLDLGDLRVVHAAWDSEAVAAHGNKGLLTPDLL